MPDKNIGRPVPRPKTRIAPRVVARPKRLLPMAEPAAVAGEQPEDNQLDAPGSLAKNPLERQPSGAPASSPIDRRKESTADHRSRIDMITQIRRQSEAQISAELQRLGFQLNDTLEELRRQRNNLRSARDHFRELEENPPPFKIPIPARRPKGRPNIKREIISTLVSAIEQKKYRQELEKDAAGVARVKNTITELEKQVEALERQERETLAQIRDKSREQERLRQRNQNETRSG